MTLKALEIDSECPKANLNCGIYYCREGKYHKAITYLQKALKIEPWNKAALAQLGIAFKATGKYAEGIKLIRKSHGYANINLNNGLTLYR